jgi:hypothetical protein
MKISDYITLLLPSIVGILYFITGCAYLYKKEWAWSVIFLGYSLSQIGIIIAGNNH